MENKSKKIDTMLAGQRKLDTVSTATAPSSESDNLSPKELLVGRVEYKPLEWFRMNPANDIFRKLKTEQDYNDLENAIRTTGEVTPLLAMSDGLLLKGESRLIVCKRLGWKKIPVTIVADEISTEEQNKILMLDNVARLQVDENTRDYVYTQIWPDYFLGKKPADASENTKPAETKSNIAAATGLSEKQIQRGAALARKAQDTARSEGREITPEDIKNEREKTNSTRREAKESRKNSQTPRNEPSEPAQQPSISDADVKWDEPTKALSKKMQEWRAKRKIIEQTIGIESSVNGPDWIAGAIAALDAVERHIDQ